MSAEGQGKSSPDPLKLLTIDEVAELLGVSRATVKREMKEGHLVGLLIQGSRRFRRAEIEEYIEDKGDERRRRPTRGVAFARSLRGRNNE